MYLIGIAVIPTIALWIQGYRHRDKITASDIPDNLPKSTGMEVWYILFFLFLTQVIGKILEW
jgi:hypothetical protein